MERIFGAFDVIPAHLTLPFRVFELDEFPSDWRHLGQIPIVNGYEVTWRAAEPGIS